MAPYGNFAGEPRAPALIFHPTMNRIFPAICIVLLSVFLDVASGVELETVFLWPDKIEQCKGRSTEELSSNRKGGVTRIGKVLSPSITLYPAPDKGSVNPALVICPGGGYQILAIDKEGSEIAEWLNSIGITAIVLKYSVPNQRDEALKDIQRAMGVVRQKSAAWKIDPKMLGVIGFSAGANLAARLGNADGKRSYDPVDEADRLDCRPDFCALIYPAWLDAKAISEKTPPTFVLQTKDDQLVNDTIPYVNTLREKQRPHEFHLFDAGGHGYGLRPSQNPVSGWPKLCETWMQSVFAQR